jgi:hypothetical protein
MLVAVAVFAVGSSRMLAQSSPTLRELATRDGGVHVSIIGDGPMTSLANIVKRADLIIKGKVSRRVSYLTPDDRDVYTDYELAMAQTLFQRQVVSTDTPGIALPLIFKSRGGRVVTDGLEITVEVRSNSALVTIVEGDEVYLFARRDATDGKWLMFPFDVFTVRSTEVVAPDRLTDLEKVVPKELFLRKLGELLPSAPPPTRQP